MSAIQQKDMEQIPSGEQNFNYYHEYCRLFIANVVLTNQMKELVNEKDELYTKLNKLEKKSEELGKGNEDDDKKKRHRRVANQINRHFKCPIEQCKKSYGSEGSLNQHIKLKHPEIYTGSEHFEDTKSSYSMSEANNMRSSNLKQNLQHSMQQNSSSNIPPSNQYMQQNQQQFQQYTNQSFSNIQDN